MKNDFFVILFAIIVMIVYILSQNYIHDDNKMNCKVPLYDIIHSITPDLNQYEYLINVIILILFIYVVVFERKYFEWYTFIYIFLIIILLRSVISVVTILPSSHPSCTNGSNGMNFLSYFTGGCNDKIFSGHMALLLLLLLLIKCQKWKKILIGVLYGILLIITRSHYTVDIIVSIIVTLFVYVSVKKKIFI